MAGSVLNSAQLRHFALAVSRRAGRQRETTDAPESCRGGDMDNVIGHDAAQQRHAGWEAYLRADTRGG